MLVVRSSSRRNGCRSRNRELRRLAYFLAINLIRVFGPGSLAPRLGHKRTVCCRCASQAGERLGTSSQTSRRALTKRA